MAGRPVNKTLEAGKTGGADNLERNGLLIAIRDLQIIYIEKMRRRCYDLDGIQAEAESYISAVLKQCGGVLGRGENPNTVISSMGATTAFAGASAGITDPMARRSYDRIVKALERAAGLDVKLAKYWDKCKSAKPGLTPFSAETAAMAELAMDMEYYTRVRRTGGDQEAMLKAEQEFVAARKDLFKRFESDNIDAADLLKANQSIVTDLVLSKPEPYAYMFSYVWDDTRVDLSQAVQFFGPGEHAKSIYRIPVGGLSYLKSGNRFLYRFSFRPIYLPNTYDDMIYDETREHYGPILQASRTGDKSYLSSQAYQASIYRVQQMQNMMRADNYSPEEISGVMRAAANRCEMYYATETEQGRKEWREAHPDEVEQLDAEKARRESGQAAKKEHIKITSAAQESDTEIQWLVCPAEDGYEPELMRQAGSKLALGMKLRDSFTEQDYVQLASVMAEFAESINPVDDSYNLERWYVPLKSDPEACMDRFVRKYFRLRMDPWQRKRFDLVNLARKTAEPVLDKDQKLVAVRSVGDIVSVGDTGGKVRGSSHVGNGCWVDSRSGVINSDITGGVLVLMQSSIKNSQIDGAGIIANTVVNNSKISGVLEPSRMRKERNMGGSAARLLAVDSEVLDYIPGETPEDKKRYLENARRQAVLRASLYKDKTVEGYIQLLNDRDMTAQSLEKLTPQQLREKEEERRRRHNEQSRLADNKNQDYAATKELVGVLKQVGVPDRVIRETKAWGREAAQVDSIDVEAESHRIIAQHDSITSALRAAEKSEELQAQKEAAAENEIDSMLPGSKYF